MNFKKNYKIAGVSAIILSMAFMSGCSSASENHTEQSLIPSTSISDTNSTTVESESSNTSDSETSSNLESLTSASESSEATTEGVENTSTSAVETTEQEFPQDFSMFPKIRETSDELQFKNNSVTLNGKEIPNKIGDYRVVNPDWYSELLDENGVCTKRFRASGMNNEKQNRMSLSLYYVLEDAVNDEVWWNNDVCESTDFDGKAFNINISVSTSQEQPIKPEDSEHYGTSYCADESGQQIVNCNFYSKSGSVNVFMNWDYVEAIGQQNVIDLFDSSFNYDQ